MSKLQATVDGQSIQFAALPKIFSSLNTDLPSGKISLSTGEFAYWRLHRNLTDLKRKQKGLKETVVRLTEAFKTIVRSRDFANHYGLSTPPQLPEDHELHSLFRNLLSQNTNRVSYTSTYFGGQRPRVEAIQVIMGNMVFLNAHKGMENPPRAEGITGRMWMDKKNPESFYTFSLISPVIALGDRINAERLAQEITNKIKQNLPDLVRALRFEFDPGQFDSYLDNGLSQLAQKHNTTPSNKEKKAKSQNARGQTPVLQHVDESGTIPAKGPRDISEHDNRVKVTTITLEENELGVELAEARGMYIEDFREQYRADGLEDGTFALVYDLKPGLIKKMTVKAGVWEETIPAGQQADIEEAAKEAAEDAAALEHHQV